MNRDTNDSTGHDPSGNEGAAVLNSDDGTAASAEAGPARVDARAVDEAAVEAESPADEAADGDAEGAEERAQRRRQAAFAGARRQPAGQGMRSTVGERIAELAELAGSVTDLDEPADIYGNGVVARLEERVAELLGTEAAAFFPSGTMAQQVALRCWAGRTGNPAVALHPLAHPELHERDALREVSGLRTVHPTHAPRLPTAEEVRGLGEPFGTLMLELPLRDAGFTLPTWEELVEVVEAARERDAVVHFDGARLWETTTHFGRSLREIAALADSVYVSFYKSLDGFGGAALAGPRQLVDEAVTWRHRYGGQIFQQFPTAVSALIGLDRELPRLPSYVEKARFFAAALGEGFAAAGVPWSRVHPEVPHIHQFQVWLPYPAQALTEAAVRQAEETGTALFQRWFEPGLPGLSMTEFTVSSTGLDWSRAEIDEALRGFLARITVGG
ncbi:beta-eliminating lyase-related protein [Streptomyces sp. NPDC049954]|uniref:threonine aldolase family protein n=1 Tax=Streptomyces sp. NPDC049954 TaxID=3155779 RepID=UPI00342844CF